jgi:hypothetical protein
MLGTSVLLSVPECGNCQRMLQLLAFNLGPEVEERSVVLWIDILTE